MTIEQVKENILNMEGVHADDFQNSIIEAFEDYEFEGETMVMITGEGDAPEQFQAYINHKDAPILIIDVEYNNMSVYVNEVSIYNNN